MAMINGDSCYSMVCCTIYYVIKWYQWYQLTFSLSFSSSPSSSSSKCTYVTLYLMLVTSFLTMTFVPPQRCRDQASAKPSGNSVVIKPGTVRRGICKNTRVFRPLENLTNGYPKNDFHLFFLNLDISFIRQFLGCLSVDITFIPK